MPQGSFNVSRLLEELGLKNIIEMPVRTEIQPTLNLNSMAGQVPVHNGGCALFGAVQSAVAGEASALSVSSLDPGGCVLNWAFLPNTPFYVQIIEGPPTWLTGPTECTAQNFTVDPIDSRVWRGTVAAFTSTILPFFSGPITLPNTHFAPLLIPKGFTLNFIVAAANLAYSGLSVCLTGIKATQSEE